MSGIELWFWIAVAGAAGAVARFVVDGHVLERTGGRLPWGTALINVSGAFALGIIAGAAPDHAIVLILGTGFLGAYTTFSTWMLESLLLGESGAPTRPSPTCSGNWSSAWPPPALASGWGWRGRRAQTQRLLRRA